MPFACSPSPSHTRGSGSPPHSQDRTVPALDVSLRLCLWSRTPPSHCFLKHFFLVKTLFPWYSLDSTKQAVWVHSVSTGTDVVCTRCAQTSLPHKQGSLFSASGTAGFLPAGKWKLEAFPTTHTDVQVGFPASAWGQGSAPQGASSLQSVVLQGGLRVLRCGALQLERQQSHIKCPEVCVLCAVEAGSLGQANKNCSQGNVYTK